MVFLAQSPRRNGAQGCFAGDVRARMNVELLQDVRDMGRDRPPGQQQLGGDLGVRQPCLHQRGDLGFGGREAVPPAARLTVLRVRAAADAVRPEARLEPGHVSGGTQRAIDLHRAGERRAGLRTVAGADELPGRRLQRLCAQQRPACLLVAIGRG